ncbi:Uncharacterised protein [Amycolatopsis camponoti]|uniref:Uncharacterized protein n=1 Tax=Amycolatopsis camponoti TaxID=2606593 RepID=A0A6I8LYE4_9PSEU|nr:Uncharacterised protein [Amycolatopsis camponoti]
MAGFSAVSTVHVRMVQSTTVQGFETGANRFSQKDFPGKSGAAADQVGIAGKDTAAAGPRLVGRRRPGAQPRRRRPDRQVPAPAGQRRGRRRCRSRARRRGLR